MLGHAFFFACVLVLSLLSPLSPHAATSYWKVSTSNPASDMWDNGFSVFFNLDTKQCEKKYGEEWPQMCDAPAFGEINAAADGVVMTPSVPGSWRWTGPTSLHFSPQKQLQAGTVYSIDLSGLRIPQRISAAPLRLRYQTQPQGVSFQRETIWIDPAARGTHAVSIPVQFVWPVDTSGIERRTTLTPSGAATGLAFGPLRFVWNENRDQAVISAPIASLSGENTPAVLKISGMPAFIMKNNGTRNFPDAAAKAASRSFTVSGSSRLMQIKDITLRKDFDSGLNTRYVLELKTSLHVRPADLEKFLDITELPARIDSSAVSDTDWSKMPSLSANDFKNGKKLTPVLLTSSEPSSRFVYTIPAESGRYIAILLKNGLPSTSGLTLAAPYLRVIQAPDMGSGLSFLQPGSILTLSGSKKLDIYAMGLDEIRWKARRVRLPFLAMLTKNIFLEENGSSDAEDITALSETVEGRISVPVGPQGRAAFPRLDLAPLIGGSNDDVRGVMQIALEGYRSGRKEASVSRFVLVSDIGLVAKRTADGSYQVFCQQLSNGTACQGATVSLLAANGTALATAKTNSTGLAVFPKVPSGPDAGSPAAVTAENGSDLAWLSLRDKSRTLDMSAFETSGRHAVGDGLIASVFTQRGMYMPGETLHFGTVIRRFDWQPLPAELPLEAVLTSPTGIVLQKTKIVPGTDGLAEISWDSPSDCATGTYRLDIQLPSGRGSGEDGKILGSCSTRIEEFEPDTLAMQTEFAPSRPKGWVRTDSSAPKSSVSVSLSTLYGTAAAGHSVHTSLTATPARLHFKGFENYTFFDATPPLSETRTQELAAAVTDSDGKVNISLPVSGYRGTFSGSVQLEGFEAAGGRGVTRRIDSLFSPLAVILGYRPVKSANNLGCLMQNAEAGLHFIALDNNLSNVVLQDVTVAFANRRYVNSLVVDARGEYHYDDTPVDSPISSKTAAVTENGLDVALDTSRPGDFLLTLKDKNGTILASVPYTVAGNDLTLPQGETGTAGLAKSDLRLILDKKDCRPGETLKMHLSLPYEGTGLITIERDTVLAHKWFQAKAGETIQEITVPENFEGRGYVSVLFNRSQSSSALAMKPMVYAAAPFLCGMAARDMGLSLSVPETVLPGSTLGIRVKAAHPGRVVLFAVDEGILSLTGFASPNPLNDLLADRSLDTVTAQAFDLLMPDHARLQGRIPAFGGGMSSPGGRFLNPFRRRSEPPFAFWQGIADVSPDGTVVNVPVPAYLSGRIRVMAVGSACTPEKRLLAGSARSESAVRGSLIMHPVLPLAAAPGDAFKGAVIVSNTLPGSGNARVHVTIAPEKGLTLNGRTEADLTIPENGEAVVPFEAQAADILGPTGITFKASATGSGHPEAVRRQELSVRPGTVRRITESTGKPQGSMDIQVSRSIYPFDAANTLTVSQGPVAAFRAVVSKLNGYPYSCTEQLISRAFPYVSALGSPRLTALLPSRDSDPASTRKAMEKEIQSAVQAIRRSFESESGVSLWPNMPPNDFVTVYAGDFLISLRDHGREVPGLTESVLDCLEHLAGRESNDLQDARIKAYACWVLLRSGRIMTQEISRLRTWLNQYAPQWKDDVTAVLLADCLWKLRLFRDAQTLMPKTIRLQNYDRSELFTPAVALAITTAVRGAAPWNAFGGAPFDDLLARALSPSCTTTALALTARALSVQTLPSEGASNIRLSCVDGDSSTSMQSSDILAELNAPLCRKFRIDAPGSLGKLFWHLTTSGFDRTPPVNSEHGISVSRRYLNTVGEPIEKARVGDVITVEIRARASKSIRNAAMVDLLPGGFEQILDERGRPVSQGSSPDHAERREDRTLLFTKLDTNECVYTYRVRAVTAGRFLIPSLSAEAMYQPELNGTSGGGYIVIEK